jgi:hypothetical protein
MPLAAQNSIGVGTVITVHVHCPYPPLRRREDLAEGMLCHSISHDPSPIKCRNIEQDLSRQNNLQTLGCNVDRRA